MADSADSTPTPGGQFTLTVADLNTTVNHEPRVSHKRLALALGYADDTKLVQLAERHRAALERFGVFSATVAENTPKGRGRPGRVLWFTKRQALYLCTKSEMALATEITIQMVEVFDAHLAAIAAKPVSVEGYRRASPKRKRPAAVPPAPSPAVERDGFAVMRIGGEVLVVDLMRAEAGPGRRAVVIGWDDAMAVQDMTEANSHARFLGARSFNLPDATAKGGKRSVWVVGTVVAAQTLPGREKVASPKARAAKAPPRKAAPLGMPPRPDLAGIEVCGRA